IITRIPYTTLFRSKNEGAINMITKETKIGFIGTGVMGKSMARNLLQEGYPVSVYTRTKNKADDLIEQGATWKNTVAELSQQTNIIINMVEYLKHVDNVYVGKELFLENAKENSYVADMTTYKTILAKNIFGETDKRNKDATDARISGGEVGAKDGALSILADGDED